METETDPGATQTTLQPLEDMSAIELNDKLLALPIFSCQRCGGFLSPPIMLVTGVGNICGSCSTQDSSSTVIHNSSLEIILQQLIIPCPNTGKGCNERLNYCNMSSHSSVCAYRSYDCPLKVVEGCNWGGGSSDLLDHSLEKHPDFAIGANGNSFQLDIDASSATKILKLLYMDQEKFILHVRCDLDSMKLLHVMYYVGNVDKTSDYFYTLSVSGCSLDHASRDIILHSTEFTGEFDESRALSIDLSFVTQLVNSSVVTTVIRISSKHEPQEEPYDKLLNFFECPVCNHYMKPPIFQCQTGHSVCTVCKPKLGRCPTCRNIFGSTRNYALEALSFRVRFPCLNRDFGCRVILSVSEISKHEIECPLRPYNCPLNESARCLWKGSHCEIVNHLKAQHGAEVMLANYVRKSIRYSWDNKINGIYCMVVNNEIFRVSYQRDQGKNNMFWSVKYVGPKGEGKKFKYEIGLLDSVNVHRKLIKTDLCEDLTSSENLRNYSMAFSTNIMPMDYSFNSNGYTTYYCKITRIINTDLVSQ